MPEGQTKGIFMKITDQIAINMCTYGIKTFVQTSKERIEFLLNSYSTEPDKKFGGGIGKSRLMESMWQCINHEDRYFSLHLAAGHPEPQRWQDFLDDCVVYATLYSFFDDKPLLLLEPLARPVTSSAVKALLESYQSCLH